MNSIPYIDLALKMLKCSQKELAQALKVSPTQITKWKKGEYISFEMQEKFKKLLNLGEFDPKFILLTGSIESAEKWNKLIQFIAETVRDNAETGYNTTPLYDELDLLSESTLATLKQMGVNLPSQFPKELDLEFDVSVNDDQYDEKFDHIYEVIEDNPYRLKVEKIDTVYAVGGQPLKRLFTSKVDLQYPIYMNEIIENVGSIDKLFGFNTNFLIPECLNNFPTLRCYSDDDISIKFTEGECDKLTFTNEISVLNVQLYPNPGQDKITVHLDSNIIFPISYKVVDITGIVVLMDKQHLPHFDINTSHVTTGLYIITIQDSQGKIHGCKWVKE